MARLRWPNYLNYHPFWRYVGSETGAQVDRQPRRICVGVKPGLIDRKGQFQPQVHIARHGDAGAEAGRYQTAVARRAGQIGDIAGVGKAIEHHRRAGADHAGGHLVLQFHRPQRALVAGAFGIIIGSAEIEAADRQLLCSSPKTAREATDRL